MPDRPAQIPSYQLANHQRLPAHRHLHHRSHRDSRRRKRSRLFRGGTDVYPACRESAATGQSCYAPVCANEVFPCRTVTAILVDPPMGQSFSGLALNFAPGEIFPPSTLTGLSGAGTPKPLSNPVVIWIMAEWTWNTHFSTENRGP